MVSRNLFLLSNISKSLEIKIDFIFTTCSFMVSKKKIIRRKKNIRGRIFKSTTKQNLLSCR